MPAKLRVAVLDTGLSAVAATACRRYLQIDAEGAVVAGQPLAGGSHGHQVLQVLQSQRV